MNKTPESLRVHIGIFGKANAGKSSFLNAITRSDVSIVSKVKGTTTDPVKKAMELHGMGPVLLIDTAGVKDESQNAQKKDGKTLEIVSSCDLFIYLLSEDDDLSFVEYLKSFNKKIIFVASFQDVKRGKVISERFKELNPIKFSAKNYNYIDNILQEIRNAIEKKDNSITGNLVNENDLVLLVMPQDKQAPKGRLILPQVMTIREILDKKAKALCVDIEGFKNLNESIRKEADLIITDSQYFDEVYEINADKIPLTSFSILLSALKGDLNYFLESMKALEKDISRVLICEACTHPPLSDDIGTVKIPKLLKKRFKNITIDFKRGRDMSHLEDYDLVIHCGGCMFNDTFMKNRIESFKLKNIPVTNYGMIIAYCNGILDKVVFPS